MVLLLFAALGGFGVGAHERGAIAARKRQRISLIIVGSGCWLVRKRKAPEKAELSGQFATAGYWQHHPPCRI
jgi:hypothetical protein